MLYCVSIHVFVVLQLAMCVVSYIAIVIAIVVILFVLLYIATLQLSLWYEIPPNIRVLYDKIQYERWGRVANTARGKAEYCICHDTPP